MSLSVTLNNALTGLNVTQQQLTVLSQNIANANTQGYSKQVARQDSIYINGQGNGVTIAEINRKVDTYLTESLQKQGSEVAKNTVISDYNTRIQLQLGNPGNQNSIDSYINTFFNSVQSLLQTPQNTTLQQTTVNNAALLADQLSGLAESLRELQFQADQDLKESVDLINTGLRRVHELNSLISSGISLGRNIADLEDQRDRVIRDISTQVNVNTFKLANGSISLISGNGITILDSTLYQLSYTPAATESSFSDNSSFDSVDVFRVNDNGEQISPSVVLVTGGPQDQVSSLFTSGKVSGLIDMRDRQIPNVIQQLDTLAASLRDNVNALHNAGSGYPGANTFNGTRSVFAEQINQWAGQTRIAVLDSNGQPVPSPYADEPNGYKPMLLDLQTLDTASGPGNLSVQGIIDSINQYYGVPQNKAKVGALNNIQIASNNISLPTSPPKFNFDFNLNNLGDSAASFFVTNVSVTNNNGTPMLTPTDTIPRFDLAAGNTYVTSAGSDRVIINTNGVHTIAIGDTVYLSTPPGGPYDGIPASQLGGYFKVTNTSSNSFEVVVQTNAANGQTIGVAGQTVLPPYAKPQPGTDTRTNTNGIISADLTLDTASPFYVVSVTVGVADKDGAVTTSVIDYRVNNPQGNALNKLIGAQTVTGSGTLVQPTQVTPLLVAKLVDEDGVELPIINGRYTNDRPGFLTLVTPNTQHNIAIDSLDSRELGNATVSPVIVGSNRGFSHFFELNNFFESNNPISTGDSVALSALNLKVESRLRANPGLISLGQMIQSPTDVGPDAIPNYTYQLNPGDNSIIAKISALSNGNIAFLAAGGLGATVNTFSGYAGQVIGTAATNAATTKGNLTASEDLLEGFNENMSAISGVNLDVELANTVIYQNAYAASARVITVTNQLFETLLNTF